MYNNDIQYVYQCMKIKNAKKNRLKILYPDQYLKNQDFFLEPISIILYFHVI